MTKFTLNSGDIHVWQAHFSQQRASQYEAVLNSDENQRAARFVAESPRQRFIISRGIMRTLLSRYLDTPPEQIALIFGERGKPALANSNLHFNLSHSEDVLIMALIRDVEIGVDVEHIRPMREMLTVAHDNFSEQEFATWEKLPETEKTTAFYAIWTRKEAYIKATGDGFRLPLGSFSVNHETPPRFLSMQGDELSRWSLYQPEVADEYISAICTTRADAKIITRDF